jgi:hypothetical protein
MSEFEASQRQRNRISWRTKVEELAASPYPDDERIMVPIRFGDMRAIQAALLRLDQAAADLRTVGDDYPGSSCHKWCHAP